MKHISIFRSGVLLAGPCFDHSGSSSALWGPDRGLIESKHCLFSVRWSFGSFNLVCHYSPFFLHWVCNPTLHKYTWYIKGKIAVMINRNPDLFLKRFCGAIATSNYFHLCLSMRRVMICMATGGGLSQNFKPGWVFLNKWTMLTIFMWEQSHFWCWHWIKWEKCERAAALCGSQLFLSN